MPFMFRDWLPSYRDIGGIAVVLHRISCFRLKRANCLGEGAEELSRHYGALYEDFRNFFPELLAFSEVWNEPSRSLTTIVAKLPTPDPRSCE
jgi:acyl carrier protein phosphodiesterase